MSRTLGWLCGAVLPAVLLLALLLAAGAGPAAAAGHRVRLGTAEGLLAFEPSSLRIEPGDVVTFEVQGLGPHNLIVAGHPEWSHESLVFEEGTRWQQRFEAVGRFPFWCEPHRFAGMEGLLIVEEPGAAG
ncbi:plastocyanin [Cyanobium sp. PCC 7001]|uniref:plastocyanin/azurin family copper-binding protein n=1 Tax=Cyanobium sp. PCC 7001 TaxID=180281 RepID=UPI0001804EE5|nr:plastocyanin/azurin family copper-binding protein [Cyanobium sp. PCC 7001]EDY37533.1 plastocyanin [Cyanobium sp. PCC 7001]